MLIDIRAWVQNIIILIIGFFIFYNTGLHGDDYTAINYFNNKNFAEIFLINPMHLGVWTYVLPAYLIFYSFYQIFGSDYIVGYELLKFIIHVSSIFFVYKFFSNFVSKSRSFIASLFFVFFISHDSTTYWYMASAYMLFFPSLVFFSFHLIYNNYLLRGTILLILCSFCYSTPPVIFGLSFYFLLKKQFIKFSIFLSSGILFLIYYFLISYFYPITENRIDDSLNIIILFRNFIFQFLSSIDATIGLNIIFKIYYSLTYIDLVSFLITIYLTFIIFVNLKSENKNLFNFPLLFSLFTIYIFSLSMFALTGMYTQSSFNLGNRVTIYFCILIGYLIIMLKNKYFLVAITSIILFLPVTSNSNYWKEWNQTQLTIYKNINNNLELNNIKEDILIIEKNNYSKLGPFSHIELFAMNWHVENRFRDICIKENIMALTSYTKIQNNKLVDFKSNKIIYLSERIYLYDTDLNLLKKVNKSDLSNIQNEIHEIRHWTQLLDKNGNIVKLILLLNPRLEYLF